MHVQDALRDIEVIRRQFARTERFCGYRALPVAGGAVVALLAAAAQPWIVPTPEHDLASYLTLWVSVAAVAGGWSLAVAFRHPRRGMQGTLTQLACEQFAPCVAAGALVTAVVAARWPEAGWILPGLWGVLFSLGLFASYRLMPPSILAPAAWYLAGGCAVLALGPEQALAPWTMGLLFGCGELGVAAVLLGQDREELDA